MGPLPHRGGPQDLYCCPSECDTSFGNIFVIVAARQGTATVIISLQPHLSIQWQQIQTKNMSFTH